MGKISCHKHFNAVQKPNSYRYGIKFQLVKADNDLQENEYEIVDYIVGRVKGMIGIKTKRPQDKSDLEFEYGFRPQYVPPETLKVPAAVVLEKKAQELLDVVEKQVDQSEIEDARLNEINSTDFKTKALLLLMDWLGC